MLRDVALGDGDEARQARFGGEQVVERVVEAPGTFGVGEPIADREDAAAPVVEHVEAHVVGQPRRAARERFAACRRAPDWVRRSSVRTLSSTA